MNNSKALKPLEGSDGNNQRNSHMFIYMNESARCFTYNRADGEFSELASEFYFTEFHWKLPQ